MLKFRGEIVDDHFLDAVLLPALKADSPPLLRTGLLLGVSAALLPPLTVVVAIDGPAGTTPPARRGLQSCASFRDVSKEPSNCPPEDRAAGLLAHALTLLCHVSRNVSRSLAEPPLDEVATARTHAP